MENQKSKITQTKQRNTTFSFIPFSFDRSLPDFCAILENTQKWVRADEGSSRTLLKYTSNFLPESEKAIKRRYLFSEDKKEAVGLPQSGIPITQAFDKYPSERGEAMTEFKFEFELSSISLEFFQTGVGFLCFELTYDMDTSIEDIIEFNYVFKKIFSNRRSSYSYQTGKKTRPINFSKAVNLLLDFSTNDKKDGVTIEKFFHAEDESKFQCLTYHIIKCTKKNHNALELDKYLFLLSRNYNASYDYNKELCKENGACESYSPYEYIHWGFSEESMVCFYHSTGKDDIDYFLNKFHYQNLRKEYLNLYLILLHQRYASFHFIEQAIRAAANLSALNKLNEKITNYRIHHTFKVISNEMVYQTIYQKMSNMLSLSELHDDLQNNLCQLIQYKEARHERFINLILSVFAITCIISVIWDGLCLTGQIAEGLESFEIAYLLTFLGIILLLILWISKRRNK